MPVDPVCGIEMDETLALIHEYENKKYYFCCNGCKRIFMKKENATKTQLNIELKEDMSSGVYSNLVVINYSP